MIRIGIPPLRNLPARDSRGSRGLAPRTPLPSNSVATAGSSAAVQGQPTQNSTTVAAQVKSRWDSDELCKAHKPTSMKVALWGLNRAFAYVISAGMPKRGSATGR